MAKKILRLPSVSRVAANSRAILELPIGPTYKRIVLIGTASSGLAEAQIGRIDVNINAKTIQTFKNAQRLREMNAFYNRSPDTLSGTAMEYTLHFERAELHNLIDRRAPGLGTADVATFTVEIDLAAVPASFTLTAFAEIDPMPQPLGMFTRIREFPFNAPAAGVVEMDKFPRSGLYQAIHMNKSDVSYVELEGNQVKLVDASKAVLHRVAKEGAPVKRAPIDASYTHLDFATDGDLSQSVIASQLGDFRLKMTCTTSGAFDLITETLDSLSAI